MGIEALKAKRYSTAIYSFEKAGSHKDSKTQLKEAKYQFVLANRNRSNTDTLNYLKELKSAKYKDSAAIYTELFGWKAEIIANDDEDNSTRDMTSITKYSNWYFHIKVSGGEPNAETKIKYTAYFPNGEKKSGSWDDKWKSGWSGTCWFWYNNPAYGKQGTFKLKVYDGNGSLIGEKSIKITG
jgi:hypothetical protein